MYPEVNLCYTALTEKCASIENHFKQAQAIGMTSHCLRQQEFWRGCSAFLLFHHQLDSSDWLQCKAAGTSKPWLHRYAYIPVTVVPGIWYDPDPELLIDFLALAGTCSITVDSSGNWECWLTLITINTALGWALRGSPAVPLSSLLTLP